MRKTNVIYGFIGGIVLYLVMLFASYIYYYPFDIEISFLAIICLSVALPIILIVYKYGGIKASFIRIIAMLSSALVLMVFWGSVGVVELLESKLILHSNEAISRVSGLMMIIVIIFTIQCAIVTSFVMKVLMYLIKRCRQNSTGDRT